MLVQIEKLVYGGDGLGRVDGQVVLMPYVLPGERVSAEARSAKKGLLRAVPETVLDASPQRIPPGCEYFGTCGGCQYQHANYDAQLAAKRAILQETLTRLGSVRFEPEVKVVSGEPWQYRNRVQLHFADGAVGFHRPGSHELCAIHHCPISSPRLNEAIDRLAEAVKRREWPRFLRSLELFTNEIDVQLTIGDSARPVAARFFEWCSTFVPGYAPGAISYKAAGHEFRISRGSFFQVNRFLVDALVHETIGESHGKRAWDLYAGVGLFTLPLAARFGEVHAVERSAPAFRDLEWNVRDHNTQIRTTKQSADEFLTTQSEVPDLILVDPPRAGVGPAVTSALRRLRAPEVILVSCDPTTLARDLKSLSDTYTLAALTLVDLFPQTYHFETVARLTRKD